MRSFDIYHAAHSPWVINNPFLNNSEEFVEELEEIEDDDAGAVEEFVHASKEILTGAVEKILAHQHTAEVEGNGKDASVVDRVLAELDLAQYMYKSLRRGICKGAAECDLAALERAFFPESAEEGEHVRGAVVNEGGDGSGSTGGKGNIEVGMEESGVTEMKFTWTHPAEVDEYLMELYAITKYTSSIIRVSDEVEEERIEELQDSTLRAVPRHGDILCKDGLFGEVFSKRFGSGKSRRYSLIHVSEFGCEKPDDVVQKYADDNVGGEKSIEGEGQGVTLTSGKIITNGVLLIPRGGCSFIDKSRW